MLDKKHVYQVEDLRNRAVVEVHVLRLKFYHDLSLNQEVITSHIVSSEIGMPVQNFIRLVDIDDSTINKVRWFVLTESEDTLGTLMKLFTDVPQLLERLLRYKNASITGLEV